MLEVAREFKQISGRDYGFFEAYKMDDADYAMVIMGSAAGTGKDAVDALREKGIKAGLFKDSYVPSIPGISGGRNTQKCKSCCLYGPYRKL